jgi:dTDP-L-rhamnose 4-epimerase
VTGRSVLVTGGAGFIGCSLAQVLVDDDDRVTAIDLLHPQVHPDRRRPSLLPDEVQLIPADVTHAPSWDAVLSLVEPDVVVHLAAETGTGQSLAEASRHARVNVVGTTELVDALTRQTRRPSHIVLASSRAVYGEGEWRSGDEVFSPGPRAHEDLAAGRWDPIAASGGRVAEPVPARAGSTAPSPTNVYAATKLAQEHILQAWCAASGVPLSILRLQNVYGPGQSVTNIYTGVLVHFALAAVGGRAIDVYEDGRIIRDFVYVDDVAAALRQAMNEPPGTVRLVDVGGGQPCCLLDVARSVASIVGAPDPVVSGRFRYGDVRAASCSLDAARRELGWSPAWDLDAGLRRLVGWMQHEAIPVHGRQEQVG